MPAASLLTRGTVLLLAWGSLPQHLGASLRVPPAEDPSLGASGPKRRATDARASQLPSLKGFTQTWEQRYRSEHHLNDPMPSGAQLVLGIMAQPWQTKYRQVIRRTWLSQTGVCLWRASRPASDCRVQVAFVYGNHGQGGGVPNDSEATDLAPGSEEAARKEPGAFVLDVEENMNKGKTFAWFKAAAEAAPWATHIAKCDMDTYPFLHKLMSRMSKRAGMGEKTPYEYAGKPAPCSSARSCFQSSCYRQKAGEMSGNFKFMFGPLYLMSRELAEMVVQPGEWWEAHKDFTWEDQNTKLAIDYTALSHHVCVSTWQTDAEVHNGAQTPAGYANDF